MKEILLNIFAGIIGIVALSSIVMEDYKSAIVSIFILLGLIGYKYSSYMYALYKKAEDCEHNQRGPGGICTLCMTPKSKQK